MECKQLLVELEAAGLEERFSPAAAAHLDQCAHCSGLVADLKAIQAMSAELSEAEPPARLWVSLRNQLEWEGLIREAEPEAAPAAPRASLWVRLRPALASAYLAVIVAAGVWISGGLGTPMPPASLASREVQIPEALTPATDDAAPAIRERNPAVAASYTQSLEVIDNFIRLCEKTVQEQPNNEVAREYLYDAYKQKSEVLAMTMERGAWGD